MAEETSSEIIGRAIARERNQRGLTQEQLSELAGVTRNTVVKAEAGRAVMLPTLNAICAAVGLRLTTTSEPCKHDLALVCLICGERSL